MQFLKLYSMNKCLLCQKCEADKTGSHIIPSFIMKRINGKGQRDHEIGFEIKDGIVNTYFGRDIYDDKRKSITDNEMKLYSKENYDVRDYILCNKCEKYFASLESKYAPSLNLKFTENSNTKNTKISPSDALLFWCSLIWRVSITGHLGTHLDKEREERLRLALISGKTDDLNVKYALFRCKDYASRSGHGTPVCMDIKDNSVLLIVDDFMMLMLFDMKENQDTVLFEIGFNLKKDNLNDGTIEEKISPIPVEIYSYIMKSILRVTFKSMDLSGRLRKLHKIIFKEELPNNILNEILEKIQNTGKVGDKYTLEHYALCYKEVLKKHGLIIGHKVNT